MLKDVFKLKYQTDDERREEAEVISQSHGLKKNQIAQWIKQEEEGEYPLRKQPLSVVLGLAEGLGVPIEDLLDPDTAERFKRVQNAQRFIMPDEVASYLGITAKTVIRLIQRGELPAVHVGRRYLIRQRDIEEYISAHAVTGTDGKSNKE
jgi:excisionase family DNA binding protein